jgi:hypothetical protein
MTSPTPSLLPSPDVVIPTDPWANGFGTGVWVTLLIAVAILVAFLIGRYGAFPARVRLPRLARKTKAPDWYEHANDK